MSDLMERTRIATVAWDGGCPGCESLAAEIGARGFLHCLECGTAWVPERRDYEYDNSYPADRAHDDGFVAGCKLRTFEYWSQQLDAPFIGQRVLEVGFGGGLTLAWMRSQGAEVHGVEPVGANRAAAIRAGIPRSNIKASLADFEGHQFDLALYLNSFNHEVEPAAHLATLNRLTRPGSRALLVLPVADSRSRRVLGPLWPHDIKDHWVFYSMDGLKRLWEHHGWKLVSKFHPSKCISASTIVRHWKLKTGIPLPGAPDHPAIWMNFGERGVIFEKC